MANERSSIKKLQLKSYSGHLNRRNNQPHKGKEICVTGAWALSELSLSGRLVKLHVNQSNMPNRKDHSLLVSPLVVAGIVIGLVLFLSCVTIIIGSLRKDGCGRDWYLETEHSFDGISYTASVGDLRSVCTTDFNPAFPFGSYLELNVSYPDSPPRYDDCVGATESCLPFDDPPPYSLEDPHLGHDLAMNISTEDRDWSLRENACHLLPSTSSDVFPDAPPPYRTRSKLSVHIPLIPIDVLKDTPDEDTPVLDDNV